MSISTLDRTGVAISGLCILHCLLLPVASSALPLLGVLAENEMIHKALVALAIFPAAFAFSRPLRSRFTLFIRGAALFGILGLFAGAYAEAFHDYEALLTVVGAFCLAFAHIWRSLALRPYPHPTHF